MSTETPGTEWSTQKVAADRGMADEYEGAVDVGDEADAFIGQHGRASTANSHNEGCHEQPV